MGGGQAQAISTLVSLGSCGASPGDHRGLWGQLRAPGHPRTSGVCGLGEPKILWGFSVRIKVSPAGIL